MHVLELASQLKLSTEQQCRSRDLMADTRRGARTGASAWLRWSASWMAFSRSLAGRSSRCIALAEAIGTLAGRIRASHLRTHIEQTALLTRAQVDLYVPAARLPEVSPCRS
jgi:hypothetical protein